MKYTFSDVNSVEIEKDDLNFLKDILKKPYQYWQEGTGDSSVHINNKERIIFFKTPQGVFIMQHPDYISPVIKSNKTPRAVTHYIGGEPMSIPDVCLCDEDKAFEILSKYIESNGELHLSYRWIDIYELIDPEE